MKLSSVSGRYAAIAMASKLSDMQLGDSMDIGPLLTKKEINQARLDTFFLLNSGLKGRHFAAKD